MSPSAGYFTDINANTIAGGAIALNQDVLGRKSSQKVLTPSVINYMFAAPPAIGVSAAAEATFTTVTADLITGKAVATNAEAKAMFSSTKLLTPAHMPSILAAPGNVGSTNNQRISRPTPPPSAAQLSKNITIPLRLASSRAKPISDNRNAVREHGQRRNASGNRGSDSSKSTGTFTVLKADTLTGSVIASRDAGARSRVRRSC